MSEHAILPPSSAAIWGNCPGAVKAWAGIPNPETDASRAGTAAHWVVAQTLFALQGKTDGPCTCDGYVGRLAENGVEIDDEMAEGAQVMVSDVMQVVQKHGALQDLLVEYRVHMPHIHEENWGTLDVALPIYATGELYLWDYKHGHGWVQAEGNLQLINYAEGMRNALNIPPGQDEYLTVIVRIVQPFCYQNSGPVNEWRVRLSDLRGYANKLSNAAHEALGPSPTLTTGPHCRYCPALMRCEARRNADYALFDLSRQPYQMDEMGTRDLGVEMEIIRAALPIVKARLVAIEDELKARIENGDGDAAYVLEVQYGRLGWTVEPKVAIAFASMFQFDIRKEACLTVTQAKQRAPKEVRAAFKKAVESVSKREPSGRALVPAQNSRTARAFKPK